LLPKTFYVTQIGLGLGILLPLPSEYWEFWSYRLAPPGPAPQGPAHFPKILQQSERMDDCLKYHSDALKTNLSSKLKKKEKRIFQRYFKSLQRRDFFSYMTALFLIILIMTSVALERKKEMVIKRV
jgi:hypothetical protein